MKTQTFLKIKYELLHLKKIERYQKWKKIKVKNRRQKQPKNYQLNYYIKIFQGKTPQEK